MDKEKLRQLLGSHSDISPLMEKMFGDTYLDSPDTSKNDIPEFLTIPGYEIHKINDLWKASLEKAPILTCEQTQGLIRKDLAGYINGEERVSEDDWWAVIKHMRDCPTYLCYQLYDIIIMDKDLTPEEMKAIYKGELISLGIKIQQS